MKAQLSRGNTLSVELQGTIVAASTLVVCSNPNLHEIHFQSVNSHQSTSLDLSNTQEELNYSFNADPADPSPIDIYRTIEEGEYDWRINCGYLIDSGTIYIDCDMSITVWDDTTYSWSNL